MSKVASKSGVLVSATNLQRSFKEGEQVHSVLGGVNIDVTGGEVVALRGRSGSGKSTLLNLISGIDSPDEGDIIVAGRNITTMSEHERTIFRRENIGFVYQAFNLVHTLSVADNIRLVLELNSVRSVESDERIAWLLEAVGLANRSEAYPDILSGGEQQRVAIARALAHNPLLLLADEPTGNLDDQTAEQVLDLMDRLVRQSGGTMIIATHSAAVAASCDRVLELHSGVLRP